MTSSPETLAPSIDDLRLASMVVASLTMDGVDKAKSGHPGAPMGMAEIGAELFLRHLRYNPEDPNWLGRDRLVLSNGHASMWLYSLLHLAGYERPTLDDLKNFRQMGSVTAGHPESDELPGVETTTGPLGQGIANAVGMAIVQKHLGARFNAELFDRRVYCLVGDGCMMEGVAQEAVSTAGNLKLNNLIVIYDSNHISIAGRTELAFTENVGDRFEAMGWSVDHAGGHDFSDLNVALGNAMVNDGPTLIVAETTIGRGSPNKAGTAASHGSPLGAEESRRAKEQLGVPWDAGETFVVPDEVRELFSQRKEVLAQEYQSWQAAHSEWVSANSGPDGLAAELDNLLSRRIPDNAFETILTALPVEPSATRKTSAKAIQVLADLAPGFVGGSADLEPSCLTLQEKSNSFGPGNYGGRNIHFGVREHGMAAIMNGMSHCGLLPYGSTFLGFHNYHAPAVRLAALSKIPGIFIYTHDSVFLGEDGPTHQPIEQIASMRAIPNLWVFRPANRGEVAAAYVLAATRDDGPCAICLTRQTIDEVTPQQAVDKSQLAKGAYTIFERGDMSLPSAVVIVATGSEIPLAVETARDHLAGRAVRVVSMFCYELFSKQDRSFRDRLIPGNCLKVSLEAGTTLGWTGMLGGGNCLNIGIDHFGFSAPAGDIAEKIGFTSGQVAARITKFSTSGDPT